MAKDAQKELVEPALQGTANVLSESPNSRRGSGGQFKWFAGIRYHWILTLLFCARTQMP